LETIDPARYRQLIEQIPCRLILPPRLAAALAETGYQQVAHVDERRAARYRVCVRTVLQIRQSLPAFPRQATAGGAIVRDVSRTGLAVIYHEQLFPQEIVRVWLPTRRLEGTVARCRRLGPRCFEVGVQLDQLFNLADIKDWSSAPPSASG
jgi:hypothetical protein